MSWPNIIVPLIIIVVCHLTYGINNRDSAHEDKLAHIGSLLMDAGFKVKHDSLKGRLQIIKDESYFDIVADYILVPKNGIVLHVTFPFQFNGFIDDATSLNDHIANIANQRFRNTKCLAYNNGFIVDRIVCIKRNSKDLKALVNQAISEIIEMSDYVVYTYRVAVAPAEPEDHPATVGFSVPDNSGQPEELMPETVTSNTTGRRPIGFR